MTTQGQNKKTKKSTAARILESIPKSIEHSKMLQNAAALLSEVQKIKAAPNEEIGKLINKVKDSYQDIESRVNMVGGEAKKQAKIGVTQLLKTWNENKDQLPKKLTSEVDRLLDKVGLKKEVKAKVKVGVVKAKPKAVAAKKAKAKATTTKTVTASSATKTTTTAKTAKKAKPKVAASLAKRSVKPASKTTMSATMALKTTDAPTVE